MKRLILMRHAKSDWSAGGLADHDRPLNARGRKNAAALGDWLRGHDLHPDDVLCSSAQRTGETLACLALPDQTATTFTRALYHADAQAMLDALHKADGDVVLMVGHNPGIANFARMLLQTMHDDGALTRYPTGATLVVDFDVADWTEVIWHSGRLHLFVVPRALPGMA